jgi:hypothetical protein
MPSATASGKRSWRAMSAPRWQRVWISSCAYCGPLRRMSTMPRSRSEKPTVMPVWVKTKRSICGRLSPTVLKSRLKARSSDRYSSQMRAALLLQPRSFSSSV